MADTTTAPPPSGGLGADLGGIYDLIRGLMGQDQKDASKAANIADPLNVHRGEAGDMLMKMLTDPGSFQTDPGYQFALKQGQDSIENASNALYGGRRTGSLAPELAKFTEGYAEQAFDTREKQLFDIASGNPAAAGAITAAGTDKNQTSLAGGITGIGNILGSLLGLGSGGSSGGILGLIQKAFGLGGGGGATLNPDGTVNWGTNPDGTTFTGTGDEGGWPGDTTGGDFTGTDPSSWADNPFGGTDPFGDLGL